MKKKKNNKLKKIITIIAIFLINALGFINAVYAIPNIDTAYICSIGDCGQLLKYKGAIVQTDYVQYSNNGISYPAYCMDKTKERSTNRAIHRFCTRSYKRCKIMENYHQWISLSNNTTIRSAK